MKKFIKSFLVLILTTALLTTAFPAATASAYSNNSYSWSDWAKDIFNWDYEDENTSEYLVLIGQKNGSYIAYDDIAFITAGSNIMVKAKPLATALGLNYSTNKSKNKKTCTLSLGRDQNVYFRNSKTYYFYDYNENTRQTRQTQYRAQYKQIVYANYNAVHYATLSTLVNYRYYDTNTSDYKNLGYKGVVVYSKYYSISGLPNINSVINFDGYIPGSTPNNNYPDATYATIHPSVVTDTAYNDIKYVEAGYTVNQASNTQVLELSEVLNTFKAYGQPYNGIYGSGKCDTPITIQAFDINWNYIGEQTVTGGIFLLKFPNAEKLTIQGTIKDLVLDFTPAVPTLITGNIRLPFNQISWLYTSDGYARQYFVIADHMRFYAENVVSPYTTQSRKRLSTAAGSSWDNADCYQRITTVFKSPYTELISPYCYINVQKSNNGISNPLVVFSDTGSTVLAADYESKLLSMISTLNKTGLNIYFPSQNFNRQLVMKLASNSAVDKNYSYIVVDATSLNLDYFYDYYLTLHEMTHYYEATQLHYGFRFEAWTEGNAATLADKTMDALGIAHKDPNGNDYIQSMFATNFGFLTQDNKNNFEAYYLNATGWNATLIGYHFTKYLQDIYGQNIISRILEKVYAAKIPTNAGRNSTYDKLFTDCIKAVTVNDVFNNFSKYYIH